MQSTAVETTDLLDLVRQQTGGSLTPPPLRCVLMDDSEFDRRSLIRVAEKSTFDFEFVETRSIEETRVAISGLHPPDIVLLDYRVPDGNGIDFAREICRGRKRPPFSVIVITGDSTSAAAIEALRAGVADFLPKDQLSLDVFDGAIENAIHANSRLSAAHGRGDVSSDVCLQALRTLTLANMRRLKTAVLPVLALGWKAANGKLINDEGRAQLRTDLADRAREIPALIDDLLIAVLAGNAETAPAPVSVADVVRSIVDEDAEGVLRDGADVEIGALPDMIADPSRMKLLLTLLINGAAQGGAIGQRPVIRVGAGRDPAGNPILWVRDDGLGLTVRRQTMGRTLTDMRVSNDDGQDPFAWSLCQRIAEQLGGKFKVVDDPEGGVRAMVLMPWASLA